MHFIGQNKEVVENNKEQTTGRGSDFGYSMDNKGVSVSGKSWEGSWPDGTVICRFTPRIVFESQIGFYILHLYNFYLINVNNFDHFDFKEIRKTSLLRLPTPGTLL